MIPFSVRPELATTGASNNRPGTFELLSEYYRFAEPWVRFSCEDAAGNPGFFTFGNGAVCFGKCSSLSVARSPKPPLPDALPHAFLAKDAVHLPFNLDEVVCNLRNERYTQAASGLVRRIIRDAYYFMRPSMGVRFRKRLQQMYLYGWRNIPFPIWPIDRSADRIMERALALGMEASGAPSVPFIWFWPNGHHSCAMITHDVETAAGRDFCSTLMDLDDSCGMKSSFQVVPECRYEVPRSYLAALLDRGFEVNVHDLNHDGMLFSDEKTFMQRVHAINRYGREFGARGFRAGVMYRNQEWYHALEFEYDMSVPNAAHLEPQRGGCCTIMPYFIGNVLELPLTTTQDYTMFHILNERSIRSWEREIEAIHRHHGLISILTHPDYLTTKWAQSIYLELLHYLAQRASAGNIWLATPAEVNDWWRTRSKLCLTKENGSWQITGQGCERARIAYASRDGNNVQYSLEPPQSRRLNPALLHL
jgi:hypothetical protein